MADQDWTTITFNKKHKEVQQQPRELIPRTEQNIRSDDTLPPEHVDPLRVRRLIALRRHLNIKMDDMAKSCSIPPSEYRHMENGKLIKSKAGAHLNKIFTKYRQVLMSANI